MELGLQFSENDCILFILFLHYDLFSRFFVSSWLIVWADGINRCGCCLAGGRGC